MITKKIILVSRIAKKDVITGSWINADNIKVFIETRKLLQRSSQCHVLSYPI